ncbi:MAG: hypothetical protein H6909_00805 [Rickettsiaceae bacterium]|nr:hypothetical protein [Rickettsiaceae bacterium]
MKTNNLSLELMVPSQINKDIIYNEAILKLDDFSNLSICDFIETTPLELDAGVKYIIRSGENKNKICYRPHESKPIMIHEPRDGMVIYMLSMAKFLFYAKDVWQDCINMPTQTLTKQPNSFSGIYGQHLLPANVKNHYLYLSEDTEIIAQNLNFESVNLIIKQSNSTTNNLTWSSNILWNNENPPSVTPAKNSLCFFKLYALPETDHYFGIILGQNFNY